MPPSVVHTPWHGHASPIYLRSRVLLIALVCALNVTLHAMQTEARMPAPLPPKKLDLEELIKRIQSSDRAVVLRHEERALPLTLENGAKTKPISVREKWSEEVDKPGDFAKALVSVFRDLDPTETPYCFCTGQPLIEFYRKGELLLFLRAKHDKVFEIGGIPSSGTYAANKDFACAFYTLLRGFLHKPGANEQLDLALTETKATASHILNAEEQRTMNEAQKKILSDSINSLSKPLAPSLSLDSMELEGNRP